MGGVIDAIGGAAKDFVSDPWSVAVPMYGLTKGVVKAANGDYAPSAAPQGQPQAPQAGYSQEQLVNDLTRDVWGVANKAISATRNGLPGGEGDWRPSGFIAGMNQPSPSQPSKTPEPAKAPFAGAWDYQQGKGAQWSGPKTSNRI